LSRLRLQAVALILLAGVAIVCHAAGDKAIRVALLENSPPMAYRNSNGELTGFTVTMMRALCEEMRLTCAYQVTTLERVLDEVAAGEVDIGAVSLLETPERRARVIFAKPYFRSISLWFAKNGVLPGQAGLRVAVVRGSAQERFARGKGWEMVPVKTNGDLAEPLAAGIAQAAIIPMSTGLGLMNRPDFRQLGLSSTVMNEAELGGDVSFIISPRSPELKEQMDAALDRIKRNGTYDRINSQFLPFRVN
jgi:ABC-type amino acid transport substrate-binding protein